MVHNTRRLFCKLTYLVRILIAVTLKALLDEVTSLDTGACPDLIKRKFLLTILKDSVLWMDALQLQTACHEVVDIEVIVPLLVWIGDECVRAWFEIVEKFAVHVFLRACHIVGCIRAIFPTEQKADFKHSRQIAIITNDTVNDLIH